MCVCTYIEIQSYKNEGKMSKFKCEILRTILYECTSQIGSKMCGRQIDRK